MSTSPIECGIALGSNSGDRMANLSAAVAALREREPGVEVSPVYETAPVDCPDGSGAFYNAVAILRWHGTPESLHDFLRGIESSLGRPPSRTRNAPRTIDLDILYAGDEVRGSEALIIPHPRFHLRSFVLTPLCDLRPRLRLKGFSFTAGELLLALPQDAPRPRRVACML